MILIADSGSTSTEWRIINKNETIHFKTIGLSPYFVSTTQIDNIILNAFPKNILTSNICTIYFYGTGCKSQESKQIIATSLLQIFKNATITVETDLHGAAKALFGNRQGIACILGTGMNAGYWNGADFEYTITSLGYILGDEGGGAYIGKSFIKKLLEGEFSEEIERKFLSEFNLSLDKILSKIYSEPSPNKFLASFVPFLHSQLAHDDINVIIQNCFKIFISKHLLNLSKNYDIYNISAIGSVAYFFQDILKNECAKVGLELQTVFQSPIDKLCEIHS